ncbi:hypothetical protein E2C01_044007 [Portunus trituberculatus]|uniref:Uncharacterized protein n=1 Tax=Portunus trituberculatus TaxID=210409 RepID=A0A5B7FXX4_PORTR|nr:hypothetical protein [Portunus trituberculatus]
MHNRMIVSGRNYAKSVHQLVKHSFINRKCQNLSNSTPLKNFWHKAQNISNNFTSSSFSPLFHPDGTTAISSVFKAELFSQTFANNSILDDYVLVPPSSPPSDYFMSLIKVFHNNVFHTLTGLHPQKTSIVLKNCASVLALCLANHLQLNLLTTTFHSC